MGGHSEVKEDRDKSETVFERYENLDPITFQVLRSAFESICREMGYTMCRTAYSPIFVDGQDFSCAILDDSCELIATANYDPSHLSAMSYTSECSLIEIGYENLYPGDAIIQSDPYQGGGHLPDYTVIKPVFYESELFALAVSRAHHLDVGGKSFGGCPGDATDIYSEGFRLPPVKWYEKGKERFDIINILLTNVRLPAIQYGDFTAQLASLNVAADRLAQYCDKYGPETVKQSMMACKDYSESKLRSRIREIPDGVYEFEDFMDDDGVADRPYKIRVRIEVKGGSVVVDYTGSSPQALGPINSVYANTASSTFNVMLHTLGHDIPFNYGCFRPIRLVAPRGTLVNPNPPAPVFGGVTDTTIRLIDVVMGALAQAIPDKVIAATYGTCSNFTGGGQGPKDSRDYIFLLYYPGGWGASSCRDGWDNTPNQTSNFKDCPVEIIESNYPILVERISLNEDSAGPGRFRGGFGAILEYRMLGEKTAISALGERYRIKPWGLYGGYPGKKSNAILIRRKTDKEFRSIQEMFGTTSPSKFSNIVVECGDTVGIVTAGGGGYGDPLERDPGLVLRDVEQGLLPPESAKEDYGVVIKSGDYRKLLIDERETQALRKELSGRKPENIVYGCVSVDGNFMEWKQKLSDEGITQDPYAQKIEMIVEQISNYRQFCKSECIKGANPKRCPYYNHESLAFWNFDVLASWTRRQCPLMENSKLKLQV